MERESLPDWESEKEHYQTHQNGPEHPGYVQFLNQAITPALPFLKKDMRGIDYGCGPGPTLSILLEKEGLHCENYDPFFFPTIPSQPVDFIFSTETVEHFFYPGRELAKIRDLLKPGGILTMMTETWQNRDEFQSWYYAKDFTHVSFYHAKTIDMICAKFGFILLTRENPRVCVMRKAVQAND